MCLWFLFELCISTRLKNPERFNGCADLLLSNFEYTWLLHKQYHAKTCKDRGTSSEPFPCRRYENLFLMHCFCIVVKSQLKCFYISPFLPVMYCYWRHCKSKLLEITSVAKVVLSWISLVVTNAHAATTNGASSQQQAPKGNLHYTSLSLYIRALGWKRFLLNKSSATLAWHLRVCCNIQVARGVWAPCKNTG